QFLRGNAAEEMSLSQRLAWSLGFDGAGIGGGVALAYATGNGADALNWAQRGQMLSHMARTGVEAYMRSGFAGGAPPLAAEGSKPIEDFRPGDLVLARDENDPNAAVQAKVVEEVFLRLGRIWHVKVRGRIIRTTGEHPFWVHNKGLWLPVMELEVGDVFLS